MSNPIVACWPGALAPREKLLMQGAAALSDAELLAIFLRTGLPGVHVMQLAEQLLRRFGSLYHLMSADHQAFCSQKAWGRQLYAAAGDCRAGAALLFQPFVAGKRHAQSARHPALSAKPAGASRA